MKRIGMIIVFAGMAIAAKAADPVTVARGETRIQDINAFGGRVTVEGKLNGSVFMIGGKLVIGGEVSEDIICLFTDVEIRAGAVIGKDVWIVSDRLQRADNSFIGGRLVQVKNLDDLRKMASTVLPFFPDQNDQSIFKAIKITFWFILALIIFAIFPEKVARTAENPGRPLARLALSGFGIYLLFILHFIIFAVLCLLLIGIPLLLVLITTYFVALAFGRTVVFYFLGSKITALLRIKRLNPTYYFLLGIIPYALCKFIPYLGMALIFFMDFVVLGISAGVFLKKRAPH